jgi:hypothetical protein
VTVISSDQVTILQALKKTIQIRLYVQRHEVPVCYWRKAGRCRVVFDINHASSILIARALIVRGSNPFTLRALGYFGYDFIHGTPFIY